MLKYTHVSYVFQAEPGTLAAASQPDVGWQYVSGTATRVDNAYQTFLTEQLVPLLDAGGR